MEGAFRDKKYNNVYDLLDGILMIYLDSDTLKNRKAEVVKSSEFQKVKKYVEEAFAGAFDECLDAKQLNAAVYTDPATLVRTIEKHLYSPSPVLDRSKVLDFTKTYMPQAIVSSQEESLVYVDYSLCDSQQLTSVIE